MVSNNDYVFRYVEKENDREEVIWGTIEKIDEFFLRKNLKLEDIKGETVVNKNAKGTLSKHLKRVYEDIENHAAEYTMLITYLDKYYIPLSKGETPENKNMDRPFEFLELLKNNKNLIYSYFGYKIDYCIKYGIAIPTNMVQDFMYNRDIFEIANAEVLRMIGSKRTRRARNICKIKERLENKTQTCTSHVKSVVDSLECVTMKIDSIIDDMVDLSDIIDEL